MKYGSTFKEGKNGRKRLKRALRPADGLQFIIECLFFKQYYEWITIGPTDREVIHFK